MYQSLEDKSYSTTHQIRSRLKATELRPGNTELQSLPGQGCLIVFLSPLVNAYLLPCNKSQGLQSQFSEIQHIRSIGPNHLHYIISAVETLPCCE
jgi:hypothetical protein